MEYSTPLMDTSGLVFSTLRACLNLRDTALLAGLTIRGMKIAPSMRLWGHSPFEPA
jgi:hypothetical protein